MATPRIIGPADELDKASRYCTCCERPLRGKVAWLELDHRTDTYHDRGDVPVEQSQGWFPFGDDLREEDVGAGRGSVEKGQKMAENQSERDTQDFRDLTQMLVEDGDIWALMTEEQREVAMRQFMRLHADSK